MVLQVAAWDLLPKAADMLPGRDRLAVPTREPVDSATVDSGVSPSAGSPRVWRYRGPQPLAPSAGTQRPISAPPVMPRSATLPERLAAETEWREGILDSRLRPASGDLLRDPSTSTRPLRGQGRHHQLFLCGQWQRQAGAVRPWSVRPGPGLRRLGDRLLTPAKERVSKDVSEKPFGRRVGSFCPAPGSLRRSGQTAVTPTVERPLSRLAMSG
eukprot:TRINITY_DN15043_c0_g1_i1.p1 TRINITY_DN15043_c0_g1~~TRINITY_DN15043_c0_g1_i1.p1  ORF type:complete len:234 (+),score=54.74 TRINITY_DN15043_c0_g1_i1:64-702(+)